MMKKHIPISAAISIMVLVFTGCARASVGNDKAETTAEEASAAGTALADKVEATDYSRKESWLQIPEITRDVDTFYIYSTAYYESSFKEGAPDYATLDNPEMLEGAKGEYVTNASVYEKSTNVFVPYYRQAGMRFAGRSGRRPEASTRRFPAFPMPTSPPRSTTTSRTATRVVRSSLRATVRGRPWSNTY